MKYFVEIPERKSKKGGIPVGNPEGILGRIYERIPETNLEKYSWTYY